MRIRPGSALFPLMLAAISLPAQTDAGKPLASVTFTFEHPQLQPSRYTIRVDETGAGRFTSQPGPSSNGDDVMPTPMDRPVLLDDALRADLFSYARAHSFFATNCSTSRTGLAFTGNKTFAYSGPDGNGSCTFVWAGDPALDRITDQMSAVAFTLEEGRRLDLEVRHDRLGLDAELASLQDAYKDHHAADLPNIADQLRAVADDQQVMDRARKRALALLALCQATAKHQ
jgi:hypothetical protein